MVITEKDRANLVMEAYAKRIARKQKDRKRNGIKPVAEWTERDWDRYYEAQDLLQEMR